MEVRLVEATLEDMLVDELPQRPIGDRAYDSAPLDVALNDPGRTTAARYRKRWKVERLCSLGWGSFRRLAVRYEYHADCWLGFVHLGYIVILLRHLLRWLLANPLLTVYNKSV